MFASFRTAAIALAFTASAVAYSGAASAQTITFSGTTAGAFDGGAVAPTATLDGLSFNAGAFTATAPFFVGQQASIGSGGLNNLGQFSLGTTNFDFNTHTFTLAVSFALPAGTTPSTQNFNAVLTGQIIAAAGGITLDFNNSPLPFTFPAGAFTLQVADLNVDNGGVAVPLTGKILITAVPGPVAGAGLPVLLGMAGAWFVRRRRQAQTA